MPDTIRRSPWGRLTVDLLRQLCNLVSTRLQSRANALMNRLRLANFRSKQSYVPILDLAFVLSWPLVSAAALDVLVNVNSRVSFLKSAFSGIVTVNEASPSKEDKTGEGYSIHELPPGLPMKTGAVFEMPNGDVNDDLVWENTSTGQRAIWFFKDNIFPTVSTYRPSRFSGTSQAQGTSAATAMPASYGKTPATVNVPFGL
jgi:hypothetical protein